MDRPAPALRIRLAGKPPEEQLRIAVEAFDRAVEDNLRAFQTKMVLYGGEAFDAEQWDWATEPIREAQRDARAAMIRDLKLALGLP
jgi:hypothetical protein